MMSNLWASSVGTGRCMKSCVWMLGCRELRSIRVTSKTEDLEHALSGRRAPTSSIRSFFCCSEIFFFGVDRPTCRIQSTNTREESPPRWMSCPHTYFMNGNKQNKFQFSKSSTTVITIVAIITSICHTQFVPPCIKKKVRKEKKKKKKNARLPADTFPIHHMLQFQLG